MKGRTQTDITVPPISFLAAVDDHALRLELYAVWLQHLAAVATGDKTKMDPPTELQRLLSRQDIQKTATTIAQRLPAKWPAAS